MYEIEFSTKAIKFFKNKESKLKKRVFEAINNLRLEPLPYGYVLLKGTEKEFRIRVGKYRIIYSIFYDLKTIIILDINKRDKIYKNS